MEQLSFGSHSPPLQQSEQQAPLESQDSPTAALSPQTLADTAKQGFFLSEFEVAANLNCFGIPFGDGLREQNGHGEGDDEGEEDLVVGPLSHCW